MDSFLMWIGSAHYTTITDYSDEAIVAGVSKRVPNAAIAKAMTAKDAVVFVAHDEGEKHDCPACAGSIECPDCRKLQTSLDNEQARVDAIRKKIGDLEPSRAQARTIRLCESKVERWAEEMASCESCDGTGHHDSGTGGKVTLANGDTWDYRRYVYWRNCNKKGVFDYEKDVKEAAMCPACGGFGTIPLGKVFGMFVPERIEYIVAEGDDAAKLKEIAKTSTLVHPGELKKEAKRKCGRRHAGGVYVVTDPAKKSKISHRTLKALREAGIDTNATEVHGAFIKFPEPIAIDEKRFRGIKRWEFVPAAAAEAAEDVTEALA